ncbi:MAG: M20/M25/M40 family metallo-hydrolase [Gammaproteobacteria bacterium]|nr:M20/M25/M40 family metallo-hydrolase [Gammaproteobacteria bacterium]
MNVQRIEEIVASHWEGHILDVLTEYITIPNVSPVFDPDWEQNGHMHKAVQLFHDAVEQYSIENIDTRIVEIPQKTPLLFLVVPAMNGGSGNVLLYGHYDKQPEFTGWHAGKGPWIPVLENGRLYGRGGGDDGYALFSSLSAIAALQQTGAPVPRCTIVIEGCEESGSYDLPHYIELLADEIGTPDLVVCLDAECGNYDQLWLTTSLRGMLSGTLNVEILNEGVHSGAAGGIVPSSFRILRSLIERIETSETGQLHDRLYTDIPSWAREQSSEVAATLGHTVIERYPWAREPTAKTDNLSELLISNTWQPSLATVGIGGAPLPQNAGNTLRPSTSAKLVFRLPPNANAGECAEFVKAELERDPNYGAVVEFNCDAAESGWHSKPVSQWLHNSLDRASNHFFSKPYRRMGTGGTIPFMKMLGEQYPNCEFMVTGVLGPHSNAHGPNEFLDLKTGERVTSCVAYVLATLAQAN